MLHAVLLDQTKPSSIRSVISEIWVDACKSGWLVKYRDSTIAKAIEQTKSYGELARQPVRRQPVAAWPPLTPLSHFMPPDFPTSALPPWLADFVAALAVSTQTPVDLAGMLVLAITATACAKKVEVSVKSDYNEPVNLFIVVSLPSGNRKSAVFDALVKPIKAFETSEAARLASEVARSRTSRLIGDPFGSAHRAWVHTTAISEF